MCSHVQAQKPEAHSKNDPAQWPQSAERYGSDSKALLEVSRRLIYSIMSINSSFGRSVSRVIIEVELNDVVQAGWSIQFCERLLWLYAENSGASTGSLSSI